MQISPVSSLSLFFFKQLVEWQCAVVELLDLIRLMNGQQWRDHRWLRRKQEIKEKEDINVKEEEGKRKGELEEEEGWSRRG